MLVQVLDADGNGDVLSSRAISWVLEREAELAARLRELETQMERNGIHNMNNNDDNKGNDNEDIDYPAQLQQYEVKGRHRVRRKKKKVRVSRNVERAR